MIVNKILILAFLSFWLGDKKIDFFNVVNGQNGWIQL